MVGVSDNLTANSQEDSHPEEGVGSIKRRKKMPSELNVRILNLQKSRRIRSIE